MAAILARPARAARAGRWLQTAEAKTTAAYKMVGPEYLGVLDIPIIRGRTFADHERRPRPSP